VLFLDIKLKVDSSGSCSSYTELGAVISMSPRACPMLIASGIAGQQSQCRWTAGAKSYVVKQAVTSRDIVSDGLARVSI
jgi:hypothetical protein